MIESKQNTIAGTKLATVGRYGSKTTKFCPIWIGKVYEAKIRKSDEMLVWRLVGIFGSSRSGIKPSKKYTAEIMAEAEFLGYRFARGISHGQLCD